MDGQHDHRPEHDAQAAAGILSDEEVARLARAVLLGRGGEVVSEAEIQRAVEWAESVEIEHSLLRAAYDGLVGIIVDDAGEPRFRLTEDGKRYVEGLIARRQGGAE